MSQNYILNQNILYNYKIDKIRIIQLNFKKNVMVIYKNVMFLCVVFLITFLFLHLTF